jgi:kynureninase
MMTRADCAARDAADPLAPLRDLFVLPEGVIYLDGNSLGPLPAVAPARVAQVVQQEWGSGLIRSWNEAGWIAAPHVLGDRIATLIGAGQGQVVVADSTSVNLYKVLAAALALAGPAQQRVILSEQGNFPTDLYIAQSLAPVTTCTAEALPAALAQRPAVLMLTHVDYRTGRMHDMAAVTALARAHGTLVVWDLAHSAGAVPLDLLGAEADFAVGCGYKYLNGGPGAPAFLWVHPRHHAAARQPLSGWLGHAAPFEFTPEYTPAPGIARFLCGTPPIVALAALEAGLDTVLAAAPLGGMAALRAKSLALTSLFMQLVEERCAGHGLQLLTPRREGRRGSQVSFRRDQGGYAITQALIARGVIGDFRAPDILRFGFAPLYLRFADVWDAAAQLADVLATGVWQDERFARRAVVT